MAVVLRILTTLLPSLVGAIKALWMRRDARRDARQETALEAADRYARTRKEMDDATADFGNDPAVLREWLHARDPNTK